MRVVSPKQLASAAGVSESSIKRWCDQGVIPTVKTAGGHRRVTIVSAVQFLRETGSAFAPEMLGLPVRLDENGLARGGVVAKFAAAIVAGHDAVCRQIVFDLHMAGESASRIFDRVIAPAFHCVGTSWQCDEVEIYQERRGCGICLRTIDELQRMIPAPKKRAPRAIGGSVEGDPYMLPTAMIETVLKQNGWESTSLGSGLPFATVLTAVEDLRPSLLWLTVSHIENERRFLDAYASFFDAVHENVSVVVGGRALTDSLRRRMRYAAYCDNLQHLEEFAQALKRTLSREGRRTSIRKNGRAGGIKQSSAKERKR